MLPLAIPYVMVLLTAAIVMVVVVMMTASGSFRHSVCQETRPLLNGRRLLIPRRRAAPEARSAASRVVAELFHLYHVCRVGQTIWQAARPKLSTGRLCLT